MKVVRDEAWFAECEITGNLRAGAQIDKGARCSHSRDPESRG